MKRTRKKKNEKGKNVRIKNEGKEEMNEHLSLLGGVQFWGVTAV